MKATAEKASRWWLAGEELCGHCLQSYAYQIEVRCERCDGVVCVACAVVVRGNPTCPQCVAPRKRR